MITREEHIEDCRQVFNHIGILSDTAIARCIGFAEDEEDYYWVVVYHRNSPLPSGKIFHSKVGDFVSLKELGYPRYEYLDEMMDKHWGAPKADKFEIFDISSDRNENDWII